MLQVMVKTHEEGGYQVIVEREDGERVTVAHFGDTIACVGFNMPPPLHLADAMAREVASWNPGMKLWCAAHEHEALPADCE